MKKRWLQFLALLLSIAMLTTLAPVSAFAADAPDGGTPSVDGADAGLPEDGTDTGLPEDGTDTSLPEDGTDTGLPEDGADAGLPVDGGDVPALQESSLSAEDEIMPQADTELTIEGYTRVTELPAEGLSGKYLIVAPYNGSYYMLYPGATGAAATADNSARLEVDGSGAATGYKVGHGATYDSATVSTDFSAAENTFAKNADGTYSVTATGPNNTAYALCSSTNPVYYASSNSAVDVANSTTSGYLCLKNHAKSSYIIFYPNGTGNMNFNQNSTIDSTQFIGNMMLFKSNSGTDEPAGDPLAIPGYNQVTNLKQIKADRNYLIAAQAPDGTLYALYLNETGINQNPGTTAYPNCAATLTISGETVSAVSTQNTDTSIAIGDLHVAIAPGNGGYTIKNKTYSLALTQTSMFLASDSAPDLELSFVVDSRFNIYHRTYNRYLTFNVSGASSAETHFPTLPTGFSGWSDVQPNYIPIYLFIEGELPIEPGMNLVQMLSGDKIDTTAVAENANPDGQNSWVFTGGRAAQGSFDDVKGARTWAGHFEEYVRYAHAKQLQPSGEATTPYFQRHVINAAYEGQTLQNIVGSFDTRIGALKPRAVTYLVDEDGSSEDNFAANLKSLITKSLALQNNTGKIVIATFTEADKTAVDTVVAGLTAGQQADVLPVLISLTDSQKTGGYPNASGHFAMAQQLTDAIVGSKVSTGSNWPYGAISGSVLASDFPNRTTVDAHHTYRTPSTLNGAQKAVQALAEDTSTPATWLFMGDSITHGSAWTGGYDTLAQLFEKFVKDDLGRKQDIVINAGSSGANSNSTISDLNRRLVKYDPDVVVLMLGTNDTAAGVSEATYKANLRAILDKIMAKGAVPVLRTPPPTSRSGYNIETYAGYIRDIVAEDTYAGKVILVDQYARWTSVNWVNVFTRDSLHPDEAGHLWFVHQLIKELALWDDSYEICQLEYVEMKEPEGITIPGYTQLTNLADLKGDKGYMIVSRDQAGNLFALYPSEEGKTLGAGFLPTAGTDDVGARTASLTVDGDTVTAKWLKDNSVQNLEKLLFTIEQGANGGYIFTAFNGRHLNMEDRMFTDGSVELTVTNRGTASLNSFEIKNTGADRVLDFNKYGDSSSFQGGTYGTDFWCPRAVNVPVYLFASDTAAVPTAKESIETLNAEIDRLAAANYTRASWANLQKALTAAQTALDSYTAGMTGDEELFVTARDNLQSAYDNLQRNPVIPEVPAGATIKDNASMVPAPGATQDEPFASGTGGSNKFRIPAIITLKHQTGVNADKNGRLLAAIDARWNHTGDACGLDTIVSYSDDNGGSWNYNFPNYFGDSVNAYAASATAFIDPVMVEGKDGAIYLMVDLWPGGVALNTAPMRPANATGYVEIDGVKRLVLYTSPVTASQSDTNYSYYVGDFASGYAPVYEPVDETEDIFAGYYIDESYYLYHTDRDFASKDPANEKIYCQRLGEDSWIQQNIFFYNATLHARNVSYLWIVKSTDGGETWSEPQMINDQVRTGVDQFYGVGPGAGLCMEDGTILLPVYIWPDEHAGFIYSKDNGKTWTRSPNYATTTSRDSSESCLIQINETTVRHFYRDSWSNSMVVRYTDHTWDAASSTWTAGDVVRVENAPRWGACQVSAIKYSQQVNGKDLILYSAPASTSSRAKGVIHAFLVNEDKTMTLYNTYAVNGDNAYAYSSLTETKNGNIALLYESTSDAVIFEIIPIDAIIPNLTVSNYEGAYDGQAHSFTVSASAGGKLEYSTDGGTTWSTAKPTFTDAGTYTVTVKGAWSSIVRTETATVTISQVTPTLSITSAQGAVVAPGETITLTVHGVPDGADAAKISLACDHIEHDHDPNVVLTRQADGTWTGTHETALEDATYTFTATYTGDTNYKETAANYQVQVASDIGVTVSAYTGVYDGDSHSIIVSAEDGVTMTYCETADGVYTETLPTYTNAGTYTTYYKAVNQEGKTVSGFAHVTISKATPVLTITCDKGTELSTDGLPLSLTISGVPAADQGKFTLSTFDEALRNVTPNGDGTWKALPQLPPVTRTYTFTAVFDPTLTQANAAIENSNYERATAELTITVTRPASSAEVNFSFSGEVALDAQNPIVGTYTVPYNGKPHSIGDALVHGEGVTVQYHVPITDIEGNEIGETWVDQPPAYTQPGTYTVSCMGSKGNSAKVLTVVLEIVEGNIETNLTITPSASELTGGGEVTLTVSGLPNMGDLSVTCNKSVTLSETGTRGVYTVTLPDENAAYTFTASYSGAGSYQPADATCSVTVTKTGNIETNLVITPSASELTGGGEVTLTVSGLPEEGSLSVTCDKSVTVRETGTRGVYTVTLPDEDAAYTFTASYSGAGSYQSAKATCSVTVTKTATPDPVPSRPNPPSTTTKVEKNEDGSTTTTVTDKKTGTVTETTEWPDGAKEVVETKKDGTVTQTTEKPDGSKEVVETKPDGTVTETKTDAGGSEVAKVTDPDQNVEIKVTDPSGEVLAEVKLPAEIPVPENRFLDVPESHWASEAVHEMAGLGLVNGLGNGSFDISSNMKRGDLALILSRLSNTKADGYEMTFTDVPAGKYYANGVAWAAKSGVVAGRSADKFEPEATITRSELAVMLYRYAMLLKMDTSASASALDAFKDGSAAPDWAVDGLAWCVENGILKGKGGGILDSTATTTRAEVAVMLQRFVNLMK